MKRLVRRLGLIHHDHDGSDLIDQSQPLMGEANIVSFGDHVFLVLSTGRGNPIIYTYIIYHCVRLRHALRDYTPEWNGCCPLFLGQQEDTTREAGVRAKDMWNAI